MTVSKELLDEKLAAFNQKDFIQWDPVSIPHRYTKKQDIEIAAFFAAVFAWGNRKTIIRKSEELLGLMDNDPYEFCRHHSAKDLHRITSFRHRTFNATDVLYFVSFFNFHFKKSDTLETAFSSFIRTGDHNTENALNGFHRYFFSLDNAPLRTKKHIPSPASGSTCKRLNMFLRWMVRTDPGKIDFGLWKKINPAQLVCPLDVHVSRVARRTGLLKRKQTDWKAALELTETLKTFDPLDPVKYDIALFSMGVSEKIK